MKGKEIAVGDLTPNNYTSNEFYLYSIDLFNLSYYWEGHVYLEALWNKVGRKGEVADSLKATIKMCAAGVKFCMGQDKAGQGHLNRARELYALLHRKEFLGINGMDFIDRAIFLRETSRFNIPLEFK